MFADFISSFYCHVVKVRLTLLQEDRFYIRYRN